MTRVFSCLWIAVLKNWVIFIENIVLFMNNATVISPIYILKSTWLLRIQMLLYQENTQ